MDNFLKTDQGFETTLKLIETINRSTDDYLFIWNICEDTRWFFGNIDEHYDIRKSGSATNSTPDMMKIIYPADRDAVLKSLQQIANGEKDTHDMDYRWINRNGEKVWINCHGTVIKDNSGCPYIMIGRVSEEKMRHLYNPLTGLWNKNKLREDLKVRLSQGGYLMLIDVDRLSAINLTHGREYGDRLLKETGELCESIEKVNTVYHIDHNNFALILDAETQKEAYCVFEQIKEAMLEKCTFTAGAVPIDKASFYDETQLLDSMKMTLKKAKEISYNRIEFFSLEDLTRRITSLALLEELKQSVENGFEGFQVYYQPQIHAGSYEIYGAEALLRYQSPSRGQVFPDEFIPVLEQSRLIHDVGLWVLEQALAQCKKWREALPKLHISVNFSALQFEDEILAEKIIERVKAANLPGNALTVEMTETVELHSSQALIHTIKCLKEFDINFAIDDFGTGYSNLGYLKQLNVDEIKIDRVFVSGIEKGTYNHKLISNVIEFAKDNEIRTCCEGVENAQELVMLETLLPDIIQGYLFDKPNLPQIIEKTYIDPSAKEYQERQSFIKKIFQLKERMGIIYFDPKDILKENGVGLWIMRFNQTEKFYELHGDDTMKHLLGVDSESTPKEIFDWWFANIHPDEVEYVRNGMQEMTRNDQAVQMEYIWKHAGLGKVLMRLSGKRVCNADGTIFLEGYCRYVPKERRRERQE